MLCSAIFFDGCHEAEIGNVYATPSPKPRLYSPSSFASATTVASQELHV